ncbi:unnamed protein product [Didymodactylos carnosus]|uniref:Reverse transcriptase RNase H-like domain-containing protein n=1 Tax=Didymodactylos carnosus TaxID=1234261 RepID=A0A814S3I4_9BILA|nr:unnamed protein product [Didymodactylos carnosus]CAF1140900.1 unnamed protein product [Didymodactylos carnosus]CAF3843318.1 unnamed protein product [Didymodactylos carnosus]CAF3904603.1 unnamed protein product [Didymodactylos carnosus]
MPEIITIDSDETTTYQNLSPAQSKIIINNHILIACIDTGSSISIIDSEILNKIDPHAKIESPLPVVLQTVNSTSHPMGKTRLNVAFVNKTNSAISSIPIEFIIISNAHTKIIIGYDCLLKNGAKLNLVDGHFTLKNSKSGQIPFIVHDDKPHFLEQQSSHFFTKSFDNEGNLIKPLPNVETTTPSTLETRQLNAAEQNYSATGFECLAVVWSLKKLRTYLDGSKFECITDHSALQWLFDFNGHNKRLLSWSLSTQNYRDTMKIVHKPGKKHNNVDPLSRNPLPVINNITSISLSAEVKRQFVSSYLQDDYF